MPGPGICPTCCDCPAPQFSYAQRAASKSKSSCGFATFLPTTPPQYYLTLTNWDDGTLCGPGDCRAVTQVTTINPVTCTAACVSGCDCEPDDTGGGDSFTTATTTGQNPSTGGPICPCGDCANGAPSVDQGWSKTLSDEYTNDLLLSSTTSALPAWPALSAGGGIPGDLASTELAADGSSYSILETIYRFLHPVPPGGFYHLTWVQRFTPDDGGTPIDTAMDYEWDGTIPSGYDPGNATTWPGSTTTEVDPPSSNGVITLHNLSVDCGNGPTTLFS